VGAIVPLHPGESLFEGGLHELGPGLGVWLQPNGALGESNAGWIAGDGSSLLIDTLWERRLTARMLRALEPLTADAPIERVVNTHSDGDHWWGNSEIPDAEIIATDAAAALMAEQSPAEIRRFGALATGLGRAGRLPVPYPRRGDLATVGSYVGGLLEPFDFGSVELIRPTRTFSGELELDVGGREVRLLELGPAHTPGDLVVWLPAEKLVFAADLLFIGVTPIMWAGPAERWVAALERLLELGIERFVPGHGPVCGRAEVERLIAYWRWLTPAATERLWRGESPADVARALVLGPEIAAQGFDAWIAPERAVVNVRTIDAHRRGRPKPPGPRELIGSFIRMAILARELAERRASS
jgi:cyclase